MSESHSSRSRDQSLDAENYDWIVMKSLIDSHEQMMNVMEQHALSSLCSDSSVSNNELIAQLKQARSCHERAIEDLDTAITALNEQSTVVDESSTNDSKSA